MSFLVQDDLGSVVGANSYITEAYFRAYFLDRGVDVSASVTADVEAAAIRATDYIDFRWGSLIVGVKKASSQSTQVPRLSAFDKDGYDISNTIPEALKKACCEYAYRELNGISLSPDLVQSDTGQSVKSSKTKVDVIEVQTVFKDDYQEDDFKSYPKADSLMSGLVKNTGSAQVVKRA